MVLYVSIPFHDTDNNMNRGNELSKAEALKGEDKMEI
jgi:hypothetical protein